MWHELMTSDVEAARAFYSEVIGWKSDKAPNMDYWMLLVGDTPAAGLMDIPPEAAEMNVPPHWMAHISVDDLDAATARLAELGGTVHVPKQEIPEFGSFVIAGDPQGAAFGMWQGRAMPRPEGHGSIRWNELNTTDWEAAWSFYSELFGWETVHDIEMPDLGTYHIYKNAGGESALGGMSNLAKVMGGFPPHWLYYVSVDDIDAAVDRVKSNGGKVMNGPEAIPGGKIAQCVDPQGAAFALHWQDPDAEQPSA